MTASFREWNERRAAIEKAISENPFLLRRPGVQPLYKKLVNDIHQIEVHYQRGTNRRPQDAKLNEHLKNSEAFEKTQKTVNELYEMLRN